MLKAGEPVNAATAVAAIKAALANRPPMYRVRAASDERSMMVIRLAHHGIVVGRDVELVNDDNVPSGCVIVQVN